MFGSQQIGFASFQMIFHAQQFQLFRPSFHSLSFKILKIPVFLRVNISIIYFENT